MDYRYAYLIGTIGLFIIWLVLFLLRRDLKKVILSISFIFGIFGLIVDPIYSLDWWFPLTVANLMPGIESFILGFTVGGISSVIYLEIFREKLKSRRLTRKKLKKLEINHFILLFIGLFLFLICFFVFNLNSFYSSFPSILIPLFLLWFLRKDLIFESIMSGILVTLVSFVFYFIPELIFPGWINSAWNFDLISGILILGAPIEDLIWFFIVGLALGPSYEFWHEKNIVKK